MKLRTLCGLLLAATLLPGGAGGLRAQVADSQAAATADSISGAAQVAQDTAAGIDTTAAGAAVSAAGNADVSSESPVVLSSRITLSDELAELELDLVGGRALNLELRRGRVRIGDRDVGLRYRPGGELDRSWRALLESTRDQPPAILAAALVGWAGEPRSEPAGAALARAIRNSLGDRVAASLVQQEQDTAAQSDTAVIPPATLSDSIEELNDRLEGLREDYYDLLDERDEEFIGLTGAELRREIRSEVEAELRREIQDFPFNGFGSWWYSPVDHIWDGIGGAMATLFLYGVLVAIGAGLVYFGRDYLATVSTTARRYTLRSWLVGLAGSFLILPAFVLGIIALAISIVGIPALLAWIPFYPLAIGLTLLFGYLAVAYATGEVVSQNQKLKFEWFKRQDPYFYMLTGVAILLVLHLLANAFEMIGPWFGFIHAMITGLAVLITWLAFTVGFGAVLVSRFGTRPLAPASAPALPAEPTVTNEEENE